MPRTGPPCLWPCLSRHTEAVAEGRTGSAGDACLSRGEWFEPLRSHSTLLSGLSWTAPHAQPPSVVLSASLGWMKEEKREAVMIKIRTKL